MIHKKKVLAQNRKASFEYHLEEIFEAGIVLRGSEVKSARAGRCHITESHAVSHQNEIILYNSHIAEYTQANQFNHDTRRPRKLLLNRAEIKRIIGKIAIKGYTLIALSLYLNDKNKIKLEIALAKGKKIHDKRIDIKEKDWKREQGRLLKTSTKD